MAGAVGVRKSHRVEEGFKEFRKLAQTLHCRGLFLCADCSRCSVGHEGFYKEMSCNLLYFKESHQDVRHHDEHV